MKESLLGPKPVLIARIGSNEIGAMATYLAEKQRSNLGGAVLQFLLGRVAKRYWSLRWNEDLCRRMHLQAGFFPCNPVTLARFAEVMLSCALDIDIYGAWRHEEEYLAEYLKCKTIVPLNDLVPFIHGCPWSKALEGRKVLVVHPFVDSIERNFNQIRHLLWKNPDVLPDFELQTLKAIQTSGGGTTSHADWFAALESMKQEMMTRQFDIAIVGAGAYGLPLAQYAKTLGKKSIHLGSFTQLLFGIIGARWEPDPTFNAYPNQFWTRPSKEESPPRAGEIENGCYW